jgi:hypothetical protein
LGSPAPTIAQAILPHQPNPHVPDEPIRVELRPFGADAMSSTTSDAPRWSAGRLFVRDGRIYFVKG